MELSLGLQLDQYLTHSGSSVLRPLAGWTGDTSCTPSNIMVTIQYTQEATYTDFTGIVITHGNGGTFTISGSTASPAQTIQYDGTWGVDPVEGDVISYAYSGGTYVDGDAVPMADANLTVTNCLNQPPELIGVFNPPDGSIGGVSAPVFSGTFTLPDGYFNNLYTLNVAHYFTGTVDSYSLNGTWPAGAAIDSEGTITFTDTALAIYTGLSVTATNTGGTDTSNEATLDVLTERHYTAIVTDATWATLSTDFQAKYADHYDNMAAWVAILPADLTTDNKCYHAEGFDDWENGLEALLDMSGHVSDATRYIIISSAYGQKHTGLPNTGFRLASSTSVGTEILKGSDSFLELRDLGISTRIANLRNIDGTSLNDLTINNCLFNFGAFHNATGIYRHGHRLHLNKVIMCNGNYSKGTAIEITAFKDDVEFNSCIFAHTLSGIVGSPSGDGPIIKNCLFLNNTTDYTNVMHVDSTNNASTQHTTNPIMGSNPLPTDVVEGDFIEPLNNNFSLAVGSQLIDQGVDLSSKFTTDMLGTNMSTLWEMGPFDENTYIPPYTPPVPALDEIESNGIVYKLDNDSYTKGTFANGDPWVVGDVTILSITPSSVTDTRIKHGSVLNPFGTNQGYDNDSGAGATYDGALNVAVDVDAGSPLVVTTGNSLVSTISHSGDGSYPILDKAAVLTVLVSEPAAGSFRPAYANLDKTIQFNKSDLDYTKLTNLADVANSTTPDENAPNFEFPWIDSIPDWFGRGYHPSTNMPDYGMQMAKQSGDAMLSLMLDHTDLEKETLLIRMVQFGIDTYALASRGQIWTDNGGHGMGRKMPMLLAGVVLNNQDMIDMADASVNFIFQEDRQTWYVTQYDVGRTLYTGDGRPRDEYIQADADSSIAEWGENHYSNETKDGRNWDAYYRDINVAGMLGHVLVARLMTQQTNWNWDALFDYTDRSFAYFDVNPQDNDYTNFAKSMWETYR